MAGVSPKVAPSAKPPAGSPSSPSPSKSSSPRGQKPAPRGRDLLNRVLLPWRAPHGAELAPLTELQVGQVLGVFATGGTESMAARQAGISERALRWHQEQASEFADLVAEAKGLADNAVQQSLFLNAVESNNVAAQIFWLKNRAGWADRSTVSADLKITVLPGIVNRSMDPDVMERARRAMALDAEVERQQSLLPAPAPETASNA